MAFKFWKISVTNPTDLLPKGPWEGGRNCVTISNSFRRFVSNYVFNGVTFDHYYYNYYYYYNDYLTDFGQVMESKRQCM